MELRRLGDLYWHVAPNRFFFAVLASGVTGILFSGLIPFLLYALDVPLPPQSNDPTVHFSFFNSPTEDLAYAFVGLCLGIIALKAGSTAVAMQVTQRAVMVHRERLYRRIAALDLASLERIGQARVINLLTTDIPGVAGAAGMLPVLWISLLTVLGTLAYLLYLNWRVFVIVVGCLLSSALLYQVPMWWAMCFFRRARIDHDRLQEGVRGLVLGAKELKLNRARAQRHHADDLMAPEHAILRANAGGHAVGLLGQGVGEMASFLVIGLVVFHLRYVLRLEQADLFGVMVAVVYLTGPVGVILNAGGALLQARVNLSSLNTFYHELQPEPESIGNEIAAPFTDLTTHGLCYRHGGDGFALCDIDLRFRRGEISVIVGGNGSGKSTLAKCLSMHYLPSAGHLRLGSMRVDDRNRQAAREEVSAVYADFHLFARVHGVADPTIRVKAQHYLRELELEHVVQLTEHGFSTLDLSSGQRKRLALLHLLLEDRAICVFDEWAADQDPRFKQLFYTEYLSYLRRQGKIVIVISHDDRYFHTADQLITMEHGRVKSVSRASADAPDLAPSEGCQP